MIYLHFFFQDSATTEIYTDRHILSLHDALPIWPMDFISIPPRVNRTFLNITDETARLLAIIPPLGEDQEDRVAFATSVAPKIADQYGEETLAALREIEIGRAHV